MSHRLMNLEGKNFAEGNLKVLRRVPNPCRGTNTQAYWELLCKCGNIFVTSGQAVRRAKKGCRRCSQVNSRIIGTAANCLFAQYRCDAKEAGRDFLLTPEEFKTLIQNDCAYCGTAPANTLKTAHENLLYNGIDRVDSTRGYFSQNCVPCCKICNYAKHNKTREEFLSWLKRAYKFNFGSQL